MAKRPRVAEYGIDFSGPADTAAGWAIPVPAVFRRALDILWVTMMEKRRPVQRWTQGLPPAYAFEAGDIFYDPPDVRLLGSDEAAQRIQRTVQVLAAIPDQETEDAVMTGDVTYRFWYGTDYANAQERRVTQAQFVEFLRTGIEPPELLGRAQEIIEVPSVEISSLPLRKGRKSSRRRWEIIYRSADGSSGSRIIRPRTVLEKSGRYLSGYCEESKVYRVFAISNIQQLIDLDLCLLIQFPKEWINHQTKAERMDQNQTVFDDLKSVFKRTAEADTRRHRKAAREKEASDVDSDEEIVRRSDLLIGRSLAGVTFTIEYGDGAGNFTRRRVRWINLKSNGERVLFYAFCHSAKGTRTFRYDRIRAVIDDDGEVHETQAFFDSLGITWKMIYADRPTDYVPQPPAARPAFGMAQLDATSPGIAILTALSHSDGFMHEAEVAVIIDYVVDRAAFDGIDTTDHDRSIIAAYLRRLFPSEDNIRRALAAVKAERPHNRKLLLDAASRLASADGVLHDAELNMLDRLTRWLEEGVE